MGIRISGGALRGRTLTSPNGAHTRPTSSRVREAFFDIFRPHIDGAHFLDLFAGTGAMGIEALSRGAQKCTFIEKNPKTFACLKRNIADLKLQASTHLHFGDALIWLHKIKGPFDIVYIDPPYHVSSEFYRKLIETLKERALIHTNSFVVIESERPIEGLALDHSCRRMGRTILTTCQFPEL